VRLIRFRSSPTTAPSLGLVDGDGVTALDHPDDMAALLAALPPRPTRADLPASVGTHALEAVTLLAPIARPPKFLAIGLNYADHCKETGRPEPDFPVFFNKQSTCVVGPGEAIHKPAVSDMVDYEGELGVVIGRRCRHVPVERALEVVAGYLVVDDVTVRDWQLRAPTMTIGKSFDTHGPIGPWIVTADEVPDPQDLRIQTWVNDQQVQDTHTSQMIFSVAEQIATLTTAFTLEPGDVLATGTGAGVGIVRQPPLWLKAGDTVRVTVDGIGTLENPVVAEPYGLRTLDGSPT
jgi:2-keto-4-pentenoate hydratase/2-oxohepta-3-ene-1,7-dioic acid hydratase in catechol pathway